MVILKIFLKPLYHLTANKALSSFDGGLPNAILMLMGYPRWPPPQDKV